jgi:hypothetical protein
MGLINRVMTGLFDLVLFPFRSLDPMWGLTWVSLLVGVLMLWIFGKISNQNAIKVTRDRIRGNLIGIRLFGDDLGMLFRLQATIFRQILTYLRYTMLPMLIMLVPLVLVLIQLDLRFMTRPLEPGEQTVVKVKLRDLSPVRDGVELSVPDGVTVETPGVRIESEREVAWRVRIDEAGDYRLTLRAGSDSVEKQLAASGHWANVSRHKTGAGLIDKIFHPGEAPIAGSNAIESVSIHYAPLSLSLFGFGMNWLVYFFVASIAFGFAFKRFLGVEI